MALVRTVESGERVSSVASPALKLDSMVKTFGNFVALDNASFELRAGEVHALLGENGAGKSTLMNIAAGVYTPDSGQVSINGNPVVISGPADARARGVGMVHQHYKLVKSFTVLENIMISNPGGRFRDAVERIRREAMRVAENMGFALDLDRRVQDLSISDQQRLEIIRVLIAGARILVLDEPTAVLTDDEALRLFQAMRNLADEGRAVVFVTHKLSEALTHSDRITIMRAGKVISTVEPVAVDERSLTEMIVGSHVVERARPAKSVGSAAITVSNVSRNESDGARVLEAINFEVRSGEIYGVAGVGGNGQEALVGVLTGMQKPAAGSITLAGHGDVAGSAPGKLRGFGVVCIPSDRQSFALAGDLPISDNYGVSGVLRGHYGSMMWVDRGRMRKDTAAAASRYEIAGIRGMRQKAALLSGGNAQKLVIAREFSSKTSVVIAHSPSRGLDVRATAAVHEQLRSARDDGAAVLLISEDLDEVLLLADRIGVMSRGKIVAEFETPDRQAIGKAMVGHA